MKYYLAIDIGASSGRHIVGWKADGEIQTKEVYRFPNGVKEQDGHLIWDIEALERHVKAGVDEALKQYPQIESLSVDTWGVDYVLMNKSQPILPCYAYRDGRTEAVIPQVHEKIPFRSCTAERASSSSPSIRSISCTPTSWPGGWSRPAAS